MISRNFQIAVAVLGLAISSISAQGQQSEPPTQETRPIRIATFNASLYGKSAGEIRRRLASRDDPAGKKIASIVQTVRPDILLVNELDYEPDSAPAKLLAANYFAIGQIDSTGTETLDPIDYPYLVSAPSNTGLDSSLDLNNDGKTGTGNDAWGYGVYPGQYAFTVFSRFPIRLDDVRSFQKLRWSAMPDALRPIDPATGKSYYDDETWAQLRLSSKNHLDVPIDVAGRIIHVLASHPTPPVFDGPEDRNGARNHDEIDFWNRYLDDDPASRAWLIDDQGRPGGLDEAESFVVMGDLNADPIDGNGRREAIRRLLSHRRTRDVQPKASASDSSDRASNYSGTDDVTTKTADFGRNGYLRVDYVVPSDRLQVIDSGIFWPAKHDPRSKWSDVTDHRMVWIEVSTTSPK